MPDVDLVLPQLLRSRAGSAGDRIFLQHVDGRARTFAQAHEDDLRWAQGLAAIGVHAGDHVATMLPTSFEAYSAWLGAAWLWAVEVPVNTGFRGRMLAYVLNDSGAGVLVVAARFLPMLAEVAGELGSLETVVVVGAADDGGGAPELPFRVVAADEVAAADPVERNGPGPHDPAAVIYTSGTTGPSKGVVVPWRCLEAFHHVMPIDGCTEDDAMYAPFPTFHASGKAPVYAMAECGGRVVLREAFSVTELWPDVRAFGVTRGALVGSMPGIVLAQPEREDDADNPLRDLLMVPLIPQHKELARRFGIERVWSGFGSTETGMPLMTGSNPPGHASCGRPRPGYELRVVDARDEPVPPGTIGELVLRTDAPWALNAGYLGKPAATADAWRNGWFHTGDAFVVDDAGEHYFVDRLTDTIRRRGENISSFEVEVEVSAHPAVLECAAVAVSAEFGEDEVLVAVVPVPGVAFDPAELIEFLVGRMPHFMVPRYVDVVDALPKTDATMKVRKVELRERGVGEGTWDREQAGISVRR